MVDREKVVRAVETCFNSWIDKHRNMGLDLHEVERMKRDALELLKAQEPVPPWSRIDISPEGTAMVINCGACHTELARVQSGVPFNDVQENVKYCIRCGRKVKWK